MLCVIIILMRKSMYDDLRMRPNPFEEIIAGTLPSQKVFEDDNVMAFYDHNQKAPVHVLIVPKKHILCLQEAKLGIDGNDTKVLTFLFSSVQLVAHMLKIESGYRCVINNGIKGGQEVPHLHIHLMGGW